MQFNKYDKQKSRLKRLLKEYTKQLLEYDKFDYNRLKNVYDKTIKPEYAEYRIRSIVRQREFQSMVSEQIEQYYKDAGVTPEFVIKQELEILDKAKTKDDLSNAIKIVNNFRESLELKPKQQVTAREETNYLSYIDKKQGKIEAKQTIKSIEQGNNDTELTKDDNN